MKQAICRDHAISQLHADDIVDFQVPYLPDHAVMMMAIREAPASRAVRCCGRR